MVSLVPQQCNSFTEMAFFSDITADPFSVSVTTSNKGGSFGLATGNDSQLLSATVTSTTTSRAHGGTFSLPKGDISDEHVGLPGEHMKLVSDDGLSDEKGEDTDDSDDASEYVPESVEHEQDGSYAAHAAECEESDANETKTDGALNQQYKGDKGYENALDFEGHELSEAMNGEMYGLMEGELPVLPADHPSQPRALNKMNKHRKNDPRGGPQIPDPNGRFEGRSLIMWHSMFPCAITLFTHPLTSFLQDQECWTNWFCISSMSVIWLRLIFRGTKSLIA
jgi:hypothetical protein